MTSEARERAEEELKKHIRRVSGLLGMFAGELAVRSLEHDRSKKQDPEKEPFLETTANLSELTYGTPEYMEQLKRVDLKAALEHHYANNRHHPEHFDSGVEGMTLIDLLEMTVDWRASSERHKDGDIWESIRKNTDRFNLSPQLAQILRNTVEMMKCLEEGREFP